MSNWIFSYFLIAKVGSWFCCYAHITEETRCVPGKIRSFIQIQEILRQISLQRSPRGSEVIESGYCKRQLKYSTEAFRTQPLFTFQSPLLPSPGFSLGLKHIHTHTHTITLLKNILNIFCLPVCTYVYHLHVVPVEARRGRASDFPIIGVTDSCEFSMWVLETEPRSSAKAVNALNPLSSPTALLLIQGPVFTVHGSNTPSSYGSVSSFATPGQCSSSPPKIAFPSHLSKLLPIP